MLTADINEYLPWLIQLAAVIWWASHANTMVKAVVESVKEIKDDFKLHIKEDMAQHAALTKMILDVMLEQKRDGNAST